MTLDLKFNPATRPQAPRSFMDVAITGDNRQTFHGTSLQCVHRIVATGLEIGMAVNCKESGKPRSGIFSHMAHASHLCLMYMLFAPLDDSGFLFAPLFELRNPAIDPHGRPSVLRRANKDNNQRLSYPDTTTIVKVHFLAIHAAYFADKSPPEEKYPIWGNAEPVFHAETELSPDQSWAEIQAASEPAHDPAL
jgi:hypothetical protein